MPKISFIILTYNSTRFLEPLFNSIFEKVGEEIKSGKYELIVVDNNSPDNCFEQIKKYFKKYNGLVCDVSKNHDLKKPIKILNSGGNCGYAKGINMGAKYATGEVLLIMNPDSELLYDDFDKVYSEFNSNEKLAVAGLKLIGNHGIEKTAGKFLNPLTFLFYSLGLEDIFSLRYASRNKEKVDFVSGGFTAIKRDVFDKLNGYDEDYFMYVEDMDLCYRAKKRGYEIYYLPYATIKHQGQGSSSREFAIVNIYKGLGMFYNKHSSHSMRNYVKGLLSIKAMLIVFLGTIFGKKEWVKTYMKAYKAL